MPHKHLSAHPAHPASPTTDTYYDQFGSLIHCYTRQDALADGILIDISSYAREVGFLIPVAITESAWAECVAWNDTDTRRKIYQDEEGRLWDLVWMARQAARGCDSDQIHFDLLRIPRDGRSSQPTLVRLQGLIGPDDEGAPVITLLLAAED
jgi:hypothetical protein